MFWFATGKDDFLLTTTNATVELFKKHGFNVVYKETAGGHTWINWRDGPERVCADAVSVTTDNTPRITRFTGHGLHGQHGLRPADHTDTTDSRFAVSIARAAN